MDGKDGLREVGSGLLVGEDPGRMAVDGDGRVDLDVGDVLRAEGGPPLETGREGTG